MRVLVVEDEHDLRDLIARTLRTEGYAVDLAVDGEDGLYKARTWPYDAVILDLLLPKRSGWDLLSQLRETHATPVLILTACDALSDRVEGLDRGADDYLAKPFAPSELLARLRAIIRRSSGQARPRLEIGDVTIDMSSRTVERAGEPVLLTAREYALVELLALRRGELVSRTVIYDHLFDENDDTLSNLIEVHISNIRKKLGKEFIATRRGQGYQIHG